MAKRKTKQDPTAQAMADRLATIRQLYQAIGELQPAYDQAKEAHEEARRQGYLAGWPVSAALPRMIQMGARRADVATELEKGKRPDVLKLARIHAVSEAEIEADIAALSPAVEAVLG